jgi:hypothetical protein
MKEEGPRVTLDGQTFTILPDWIRDDPSLSDRAIRLWCVLYGYADRVTNEAWPWRSTLAEQMGCSRDTIDRATAELVKAGALQVEQRFMPDGTQGGNLYRLYMQRQEVGTVAQGGVGHPCPGEVGTRAQGELGTRAAQKNKNHPEPKPKNQKPETTNPDVARLCDLLADLIQANGSKRPSVTGNWLTVMDRMLRIDGYTAEQVERAIQWSQADDFWSTNILSPTALRRHYDRMRLQAKRKAGTGGGGPKGLQGVMDYLDEVGL